MMASWNGHLEEVRTLLEGGSDINAQNIVRNQLMMMMNNNTINYLDGADDDDCYRCIYVNNR